MVRLTRSSSTRIPTELRVASWVPGWATRPHHFADELVLRLLQVRQAVGTANCIRENTRLSHGVAARGHRSHLRGEQNQALLTIIGLRACENLATLVALQTISFDDEPPTLAISFS
jgi:hypothetical protein